MAPISDTPAQKALADMLVAEGQGHLFAAWSDGDGAEKRAAFYDQIATLDGSYPGGLKGYLASARTLLASSARGDNPLDGWTPSVPAGESLAFGSPEWLAHEASGLGEAAQCGFVLVAGGLGERLGYSRIKVELPTETASNTCYLKYYVETLLALEKKSGAKAPLPLAIMVSGDTEAMTVALLKEHGDFGAAPGQITLVKQEKVAALQDNDAAIAPDGPYGAVGGIAKLTHTDGREMTLNVEYNQLDPLLRATVNKNGDVAGDDGVHSPYPGNINQFVLDCGKYAATLARTSGVMGEFDYPKVLPESERVGFTSVESWISFSPCKNATADAVGKNPPACALSAEADQYFHCAEMLRWAGCDVPKKGPKETWDKISSDVLSPSVVLKPSFCSSLAELKAKLPKPAFVSLSKTSTLILGGDVEVRSLKLDGGLVVNAQPGAKVVVDHAVVKNGGFTRGACPADAPEAVKIRGFDTTFGDDVATFDVEEGTWLISNDADGNVSATKLSPVRVDSDDGCHANCAIA
ncbi:UTP-glucose-1-phosphate uridylyltransferase [Aureococcus anophagefferens]|nr:UTP-glucose-1-phosphate uridylyltransferase [Aureococcus anophagefferens]